MNWNGSTTAAGGWILDDKYTIGLDYGTNSVRCLIVNVLNGQEAATSVWDYEHGEAGVILSRDPHLARQHPADYVKGAEVSIKRALAAAKKRMKSFTPAQVVGLGVDDRHAAARGQLGRPRLDGGSPQPGRVL